MPLEQVTDTGREAPAGPKQGSRPWSVWQPGRRDLSDGDGWRWPLCTRARSGPMANTAPCCRVPEDRCPCPSSGTSQGHDALGHLRRKKDVSAKLFPWPHLPDPETSQRFQILDRASMRLGPFPPLFRRMFISPTPRALRVKLNMKMIKIKKGKKKREMRSFGPAETP
ncbi:hypothetical protein L209DRAFT_188267 [Thermothelomyces heterothallicus CBS 203.75]